MIRQGCGTFCLLLALLAGLSCGDSSTPTPPPPLPEPQPVSVTITPAAAQLLALGDTVRLSVEVRDQAGRVMSTVGLSWSSETTSVATVDAHGLVTAIGVGATIVTARAGSVKGEAQVSVRQSVASVVVTPRAAEVAVGDTLRLLAEARDANGHPPAGVVFGWSSSDPAVATVDAGGLVRALSEGLATIIARSDTFTGASVITVVDADAEGAALKALYRSTGGPGWTGNDGWLSEQPVGEWYGVETDVSGKVIALRLPENNLSGFLPAELGDLTHLQELNLYRNRLSGPLPPEIGNATGLRELDLGNNALEDSIPETLGKLVSLRRLNFESNRFEGPIPPDMGGLTDLRFLNFFNNILSGHLPPEFAGLRNLEVLYVDANQLTGAITPTFTNIENLRVFYWGKNDGLCGPATAGFEMWRRQRDTDGPSCDEADRATLERVFEAMGGASWVSATGWQSDALLEQWHGIGIDSLGRVKVLDLSHNGLTGRLSPSLADLRQMTVLRLEGNALEGRIPLILSALQLEEFRYEDTGLCLPRSPRFLTWLEAISVRVGTDEPCPPLTDREILSILYEAMDGDDWDRRDNWLSDRPLGTWSGVRTDSEGEIVALWLGANNVRGRIPPELGQLSSLRVLDFARNWLTGSIPPELGDLEQLQRLHLNSNLLTGPIPPELGGLASSRELYLHDNRLEGLIPGELGNLSFLQDLRLSTNRLTGPIPPEFGNLSDLWIMWLDDNELDGPSPPEFGGLSSVASLYLGSNRLSGEIPPELGSLGSLQNLGLDDNQLTGPIPRALGGLQYMSGELNLRFNKLSGPIPPALGSLGALSTLRLGYNHLEGPVPRELGNMSGLQWLDLSFNAGLTGPLPSSLRGLPWLSRFETAGTALCLPGRAGNPGWSGFAYLPPCDTTATTGSRAYLIQSVQSLSYPVPLIAGEEALLRVFVTAPSTTSAVIPPARATFFANGVEVHSIDAPGQSTPIPTDIAKAEASLDNSANAWIPGDVIQPGLEMVVEIDPARTLDPSVGVSTRIPESGRMAVPVRAMPTFNLTVVPFLWYSGPDSTAVRMAAEMAADPEGHRLLWDTHNLLPVGDMRFHAHEPVWSTSNDADHLLDQVGAIRVMEGGTGHYMATLSGEARGAWGVAWIPGWTSYVRLGTGDVAAEALTVAHELGHNMRLWHAPCGTGSTLDPAYPQGDGATGAWGIDSRSGRDVLVPTTTADLMSYCVPAWVGDYHFSRALRHRYASEAAAESGAPQPSLLLWGGTEADGVPFLHPAFAVNAAPALPDSAGPHRLVGRGTGGEVLFSLSFDMTAVADSDGRTGFVFAIPYRPEWIDILDSIELTGPTGSATIDRTTDHPSVIFRDRSSGHVRAILLDPVSALAAADSGPGTMSLPPNLETLFSRGLPEAPPERR